MDACLCSEEIVVHLKVHGGLGLVGNSLAVCPNQGPMATTSEGHSNESSLLWRNDLEFDVRIFCPLIHGPHHLIVEFLFTIQEFHGDLFAFWTLGGGGRGTEVRTNYPAFVTPPNSLKTTMHR